MEVVEGATFDFGVFLFFLQHHLSGSLESNVTEISSGVSYWRKKWEDIDRTSSSPSCCMLDATFVFDPNPDVSGTSAHDEGSRKIEHFKTTFDKHLCRLYLGVVVALPTDETLPFGSVSGKQGRCHYYYCRMQVQAEDLKSHFLDVGFDVEQSDVWILAKTMSKALIELSCSASKVSSSPNLQNGHTGAPTASEADSPHCPTIPSFSFEIPLCYRDFDDDCVANLKLTTCTHCNSNEVSHLTPAVSDFFRYNSTTSLPSNEKKDISDERNTNGDSDLEETTKSHLQAVWKEARHQYIIRRKQSLTDQTEYETKNATSRFPSSDKNENATKTEAPELPNAGATQRKLDGTFHISTRDSVTECKKTAITSNGVELSNRPVSRQSPPVRKKPRVHYRVSRKKKPGSRYAGSEQT